jgi:hypothetical protein
VAMADAGDWAPTRPTAKRAVTLRRAALRAKDFLSRSLRRRPLSPEARPARLLRASHDRRRGGRIS